MPDPFTIRDLTQVIAKTLGLSPGDDITIQRDKLDCNRILLIRTPGETEVD